MTSVLNDILMESEKYKIQSKYENALKSFRKLFNSAKPKERYKFIYPIKISGLKKAEALRLKFKVNSYMWQNCLNLKMRDLG